jgi:hypothetical protein
VIISELLYSFMASRRRQANLFGQINICDTVVALEDG